MLRFAACKASKVRLANNSINPTASILSRSRCYAANDFNDKERRFVPCGGESFVQQVDNPTCETDKDGWKYMSVMRHAMSIEGCKALEAGVSAADLKAGLRAAFYAVTDYLDGRAQMVETYEDIVQVGTTATNGDKKIGKLVAKARREVGRDGIIVVLEDKDSKNILEFVNGMEISLDIPDPCAIISYENNQACDLENPFILIYEKMMPNMDVVKEAYEATGYKQPLLIVAGDVQMELEKSFILDKTCNGTKVCVVKTRPPFYRENGNAIMQDLAVLTGGQVVNEESNMTFLPQMLGSCNLARIQYSKMLILGGSGGCKAEVEERRKRLQSSFTSSTSMDKKFSLKEGLSCLPSNAAVFKFGGGPKMKKLFHALYNVDYSLEYGTVPGGGVALLQASKELDKLRTTKSGQKIGVQLLQKALKMPVYTIASAGGFDGSIVVEKLLEQDNSGLGFDPTNGEYVDMIECGIVDPVKSVGFELSHVIWNCFKLWPEDEELDGVESYFPRFKVFR